MTQNPPLWVHLINNNQQTMTLVQGSDGRVVVQAYRRGELGDGNYPLSESESTMTSEDGRYNVLVFERYLSDHEMQEFAAQTARFFEEAT